MTTTSIEVAAPVSPPRPPARPDEVTPEKIRRLKARILIQGWIIAGLSVLLFLMTPFARPIDLFYAMTLDQEEKRLGIVNDALEAGQPVPEVIDAGEVRLSSLNVPNMTNRAVMRWATSSITDLMTMGFGDMDSKLPKMRWRFTDKGWSAYGKAFVQEKIIETFHQDQLVLTTVPSGTPVITLQGVNEDDVYQWDVQMPIIMTYATNNNVTKQSKSIVTLSIVRVPIEQSPAGIAIKNWIMEQK